MPPAGFRRRSQALRAAYALEPRREILFAEAQATRLGGDCRAAVPLYERFLATDPPPRQVEAARIALGRCRDAGRDRAAGARSRRPPRRQRRPAAGVPPPAPVAAAVARRRRTPAPWHRDPTGAVLAGSAVAGHRAWRPGSLIAARQANERGRPGAQLPRLRGPPHPGREPPAHRPAAAAGRGGAGGGGRRSLPVGGLVAGVDATRAGAGGPFLRGTAWRCALAGLVVRRRLLAPRAVPLPATTTSAPATRGAASARRRGVCSFPDARCPLGRRYARLRR